MEYDLGLSFASRLNTLRQVGGFREVLRVGVQYAWSDLTLLGFRCDLAHMPEARPARMPMQMKPEPSTDFDGFERELPAASGQELINLIYRARLCRAGVPTLYVARSDQGEPMFSCWLVRAEEQHLLRAATHGYFLPLRPREVQIEGGYTFAGFRGMGAMIDGTKQLLDVARAEGAKSAITFTDIDNVASMHTTVRLGFELDHMQVTRRRLGTQHVSLLPPDEKARSAYLAGIKK